MAKYSKPQYPPQGGEARICLTLFIAMVLSIMSGVTLIYSTVIVYFPALKVLESNLSGPLVCTTIQADMKLQGQGTCNGWSSCEEWCLGMSVDSCNHVYASVRKPGSDIELSNCQLHSESFVDHTCSTMDDVKEMNCKLNEYEVDSENRAGNKNVCKKFDNLQISCIAGICRNVSSIYNCHYRSALDDIIAKNSGDGECYCNLCQQPGTVFFDGKCSDTTEFCLKYPDGSLNESMSEFCSNSECHDCWQVCQANSKCFDMRTRRDPPAVGTDEYERPQQKYFDCKKGQCWHIYELQCERVCDEIAVDLEENNFLILNHERVVSVSCDDDVFLTKENQYFRSEDRHLMMHCTQVVVSPLDNRIQALDCINGLYFTKVSSPNPKELTTYSEITNIYHDENEDYVIRNAGFIPNEEEILISNSTQLRVNIEGCVNTLKKECATFYQNFGSDGKNKTARSVYPCYFDPSNPEFAVIDFDKQATLLLLIFCSAIPFGILILSCAYLCFCNKAVHVAKDGRMRLRCCGEYVTGIGNVATNFDSFKEI